ncbi:MAG: MarR family transcriptional regulator [Candidatus Hodarchaeota archaeon]
MNKTEFDPEIVEIEKEIMNFLIKSKLLVKLKPLLIKILSFFITRKSLTQNDLKELTGLSAGTISQEIQKMLENKIIEITETSESGQINYSMNSVPKGFMNFNKSVINNLLKWENELTRIKYELEKDKKQYKEFKGFKGMYDLINVIQPLMPLYKESLEIINNLKSQEKK